VIWLRAGLLVPGASVVMSLALTTLGLLVFDDMKRQEFPMGLALAVFVPSIVAPLVRHTILRLLTALEAARAVRQQLAIRDSLKQVCNRRYFMAQLWREAERLCSRYASCQSPERPFAVLRWCNAAAVQFCDEAVHAG
jgi:hypothetical protein